MRRQGEEYLNIIQHFTCLPYFIQLLPLPPISPLPFSFISAVPLSSSLLGWPIRGGLGQGAPSGQGQGHQKILTLKFWPNLTFYHFYKYQEEIFIFNENIIFFKIQPFNFCGKLLIYRRKKLKIMMEDSKRQPFISIIVTNFFSIQKTIYQFIASYDKPLNLALQISYSMAQLFIFF